MIVAFSQQCRGKPSAEGEIRSGLAYPYASGAGVDTVFAIPDRADSRIMKASKHYTRPRSSTPPPGARVDAADVASGALQALLANKVTR
jgi:hypothetical protein